MRRNGPELDRRKLPDALLGTGDSILLADANLNRTGDLHFRMVNLLPGDAPIDAFRN
jgi:hypothetical protein